MGTRTATGQSALESVEAAVDEALRHALEGLGGRAPQFGFLFASPSHDLKRALGEASAVAPEVTLIGCSTAGEFTERGRGRGGVALMLVASDNSATHVTMTRRLREPPERSGARLAEGWAEAAEQAGQRRLAHSTSILLTDGLSTAQERVVSELRKRTRAFQPIVGGAAADGLHMAQTFVGARREVASDAAVALHLFSQSPVGVGVEHGLVPDSVRMVATRADGNVVQEIDGRNPYEVYRDYAAARGVTLDEKNRGEYMMRHELGVYFFDDLVKARAPLAVTPEGWLACGGEVKKGAGLCIVAGEPKRMVEAAERAAMAARDALEGVRAAGVLVFDCVCRGVALGEHFADEIDAVRRVFPGVPLAGFLSYGEIARFKGRLDGYHNNTVVVAALPE